MLKFALSERVRGLSVGEDGGPGEPCQGVIQGHQEFTSFLSVVLADLRAKKAQLRQGLRDTNSSQGFKRVQLFMINQYISRIHRFQAVADASLGSLCNGAASEAETRELEVKHLEVLLKMKRRMKQMMDVSEKYAVTQIFESINVINQLESELEGEQADFNSVDRREGRERKVSRQSKSLFSLHSTMEDDIEDADRTNYENRLHSVTGESPEASKRSSMEDSPPVVSFDGSGTLLKPHPKLRTLRSLTDHLTCLTKSYTNRR